MRLSNKKAASIFLNYFKEQGYVIDPPYSLIPKNDNSLLFVNDTITPWKKYLTGKKIPGNGLCMKQPCVRLQGLNDTITEEISLERNFDRYVGYFNALGILVDASKKEIVQSNILELLVNHYNIPKTDIKIFASKDTDFLNILENKVEVIYGTLNDSSYSWKYGMDGFSGLGSLFLIKQSDGEYKEIGQLIQINENGVPNSYEFGFGLENFIACLNSDLDYSAWTINDIAPDDLRFKVFLDFYSCFGALSTIPFGTMNLNQKQAYLRLARSVVKVESLFLIDEDFTNSLLKKFVQLEFGEAHEQNYLNVLNDERRKLFLQEQNILLEQ